MLKVGRLILVAALAASALTPSLAASQPSLNNVWVQTAPKGKAPAANAQGASNAQAKAKAPDTTGNGAVNHDPHTAKNHWASNTKPAHDLFDYASLLLPFLVGAATVAVLILQLCLLRKADRTAVLSTKIAARQMRIAAAQADILVEQKQLGRQLFFAENRPKLEIRFAQRLRANPHIQASARRIYVEFSVMNTGTSAATITGSRVRIDWFYPDDVPNPDSMGGGDLIPHRRLIVSARERCTLDAADTAPENSFNEGYSENRDSRLDQARLILLGLVVYHDERGSEFGDTRTTYFCRAYDPATGRFAAIPELADWEFTH